MRARRAALWESATVECIHDQIVNLRAEIANLLIVAARMNPVGQHRYRDFALRLDPDRCAGEAEMPDCSRREPMPRAGILRRRCVPSERPGRAGHGSVARPELADYFLRHEIRTSRVARDQLARDSIDLAHGREQPRVTGDSTHRERVLVVNLADQQPLARGTYFSRR